MPDTSAVEIAIAERLEVAARDRSPIPPIIVEHADLGVDAAYRIQQHGIDRRCARGAVRVGRKIGLTSEAMQKQLGVDQPDFGTLLDEMVLPTGSTIRVADLIAPRIEAEVAVRMRHAIGGADVTIDDVLGAVGAFVPAMEIIDSRIADWRISLVDTVADNASSALAVAATDVPIEGEPDLGRVSVTLFEDDEVVGTGAGTALLGHPSESLRWLVRALAGAGDRLEAGDLVLLGAVHASVPLRAGHRYRAVYTAGHTVEISAD